MISIDGSNGEGGGAMIRVALALSTLTGKPFRCTGIRKNRPEPGLKAQHLTAINALKEICGAETNDVKLGSTELDYASKTIKGGSYSLDIGTAGSITLLLQALLPPLLFAPKKTTLTVTGGTCGKWQAPIEYFQNVLLPHLQRFANITCTIKKRGYYPKGGGIVILEIKPIISLKDFKTFDDFLAELRKIIKHYLLTSQEKLSYIKGVSHASAELSGRKVAERQAQSAELMLAKYSTKKINAEYSSTSSIGSGITLWAFFSKRDEPHTTLGSDALGEQNRSAEDVGKEAASGLIKEIESGASADRYLADQLVPFMALLPGSEIKASEITEHTKTNIEIVKKFLQVDFEIDGSKITAKPKVL